MALCHKIFKPDPEEIKRRKKLIKKRMLEEAEGLEEGEEGVEVEGENEVSFQLKYF